MLKAFKHAAPLLVLFATQAFGQVRVDLHLERDRYLEGEPVVVVVDVLNVGDQAIVSSICNARVDLTIVGVERRRPPNISGCFAGMGGSSGGGGCAMDPPPMLAPQQSTSFRFLLKDYDLGPGRYSLTASGTVPGAQFERTLSLTIVPATDDELKRAFARLVADTDGADPARRNDARAAIIESAPRFLDSLIGRFAFEQPFDAPAIEALGRIASDESRSQLKQLFERNRDSRRQHIVLTLARVGHGGDAEFLAGVLQDATVDHRSRRYAALGLGHIGGDRAVRYLERALPTAPAEIRSSMATSLGNTRSRMAAPVLFSMFGNNPTRTEVCHALIALTHRDWCGAADDPAAARRKWLRLWNESGSSASIYGPDSCPEAPQPPGDVEEPAIFQAPKVNGPPAVTSAQPRVTFPNTVLTLTGYALASRDTGAVRVLFMRDEVERVARISGAGATGAAEYLEVVVPEAITPGRWQIVIDVKGRRSAPVTSNITAGRQTVLTGISPERPHPSQWVQIDTRIPAQFGDQVEPTDMARCGVWWRGSRQPTSTLRSPTRWRKARQLYVSADVRAA